MSSLHPLTEKLLARRSVTSASDVERFLNPDYDRDTNDPYLILGMGRAVERIFQAFRGGQRIVIYGDYDCDGIPGSVILHDLFEKIGVADFQNYIPHRHLEGYGLNGEAIARFAKEGVDLIITVDCGITDIEEVAMARCWIGKT
jgi:single-stranded-DNA-specific exonuclease